METGVTVKIYGLEDIKKQAEAVREKMRELNQEMGRLECALCINTEINQPPEKTETAITHSATPKPAIIKPEGAKGLLRLHCQECGSTFGTFLKEYRKDFTCKCGHKIDLNIPMARYTCTCPYCENIGWGRTNLEGPETEVECKCGEKITLRWDPDAKEYRN